jgi:hypothetical protein
MILDAFSSDAIPIHLMTREALQLYLRKLAPAARSPSTQQPLLSILEPVVVGLCA